MTLTEQIITISMGVLGVQLCRLLPFWVFPANRPIPEYIPLFGQSIACRDVRYACRLLL